MFRFVKYAKLGSVTTPETPDDVEKNIAPDTDTDHVPLLKEHLEDGGETIQGTRCLSPALLLSLGGLVLSLLFYALAHLRAATDASCQRRMWAYSEWGAQAEGNPSPGASVCIPSSLCQADSSY